MTISKSQLTRLTELTARLGVRPSLLRHPERCSDSAAYPRKQGAWHRSGRDRPRRGVGGRLGNVGLLTSLLLGCMALACSSFSSPDDPGTVTITAYGESFIEQGIPAPEVADGWAVEFERFEVTVSQVSVGGEQLTDLDPVDLARDSSGDGHVLGSLLVPGGNHTASSFSITKVVAAGHARKGDERKTFDWTFEQDTRYDECEATTAVRAGSAGTFQITVHADHLFYDSLVSSEPKLRFGPLATADLDEDGRIEQAELEQTDIADYDPGSEDGIDDLWAFLLAQTRTLGHVDGEGHCHAAARD